ncbi:MAG: hypothetical protein ACREPI_01290 [Candidatus Dormibacterales bacterium]
MTTEASEGAGGARFEAFERNVDELWRLWHDPLEVARHLVALLESPSPPLSAGRPGEIG